MPPDTRPRLLSTQTLNQVIFDPHTKFSVDYDPNTEIKPNSISHTEINSTWTTYIHKNQVNFHAHAKNMRFLARIHVTSQFYHPHVNQIIFTSALKSIQVGSPTLRSSKFRPQH